VKLDERKARILNIIITHYVRTAEPVSSQVLVEKYGFELSSATIRNEMAQLEAMGLLYHPHTSSGRIPTDLGYRFFVNNIKTTSSDASGYFHVISSIYLRCGREIERILKDIVELLASSTNSMSIVIAPSIKSYVLKHVEVLSVDEERTMLVLITTSGDVLKKQFNRSRIFNALDLQRATNILNAAFNGLEISMVRKTDLHISESDYGLLPLVNQLMSEVSECVGDFEEKRIFTHVASEIFKEPEFDDLKKIRSLLEILEQKYYLMNIVDRKISRSEVLVKIGQENEITEMQNLSFVATHFNYRGFPTGAIGVIGPKRMDYPRVISAIKYVGQSLSDYLSSSD
jgi:heat-inducible transcriptional repressor